MKEIFKSYAIVSAFSFMAKFSGIIVAIMASRILEARDFGLLAIATATCGAMQLLTASGLDSALIQKKEITQTHLHVVWSVELLRYLLLAIGMFFFAPFIAFYMGYSELTAMIRVMSLSMLCYGMRNIGIVLYRKELQFSKYSLFETTPVLLQAIIVLCILPIVNNIWVLVLAPIASAIFMVALSYYMHSFRPKLVFDVQIMKEMYGFGVWIWANSLVVFVKEQGLTLFLGKALDMILLGYYNRASTFSLQIFRSLNEILWKVGYAQLSRQSQQPYELLESFKRIIDMLLRLSISIFVFVVLFSHEVIGLVLGERWLPIEQLLLILIFAGVLGFIYSALSMLAQASGNPRFSFQSGIWESIVLVIAIYPLVEIYGLLGVGYAFSFGVLLNIVVILKKLELIDVNGSLKQLKVKIVFFISVLFFSLVCLVPVMDYLVLDYIVKSTFYLFLISGLWGKVVYQFFITKACS